jgi:uncharacterized protein (TIGR02246 family)
MDHTADMDDWTDHARQLWHLEQIRQLKARYFRAVDTKDWALLETVFTADAVLEVAGNRREGRAHILQVMEQRLTPLVTVHHGHMPELTITGPDTATGVWAMFDLLVDPSGEGPTARREGYGHYHERYLLLDGVWRIEHLRLVRIEVPGA